MEEDKELILKECGEISNAMVCGDTDALRQLITVNIVRHANGMVQPTADWFQDLKEGTLEYYQIDCENSKIKISGKEAILTCRVLLRASVYGVKGSWQFPVQVSFQKQDGKWKAADMNCVANERKGA